MPSATQSPHALSHALAQQAPGDKEHDQTGDHLSHAFEEQGQGVDLLIFSGPSQPSHKLSSSREAILSPERCEHDCHHRKTEGGTTMDITSLLHTSTDERDELRWSSRGGFAFLFANGIVWLITAMLTFILPLKTAAFLIICQGAV